MLNVRFIVKMLGVMFILETFFMLAATVVAFLYRGSDVYPLLISSGILFGTGFLFYSMGFKANVSVDSGTKRSVPNMPFLCAVS